MPFSKPLVGPQTADEQEEYDKLTKDLRSNTYSSCIGWVIRQKAVVGNEEELQEMKTKIGGLFDGFPRLTQGWSLGLLFTQKVGLIYS